MHTHTHKHTPTRCWPLAFLPLFWAYLETCMYAHTLPLTHGNLGLNCRQTALPSLSGYGAKLHHGYTLAMVTLPKRCCGSVPSPWLLINPPSVVWSQSKIRSLGETFFSAAGWASLQTCLCCLYWTQYNGWFHFKSLIGQRHVPTVRRSCTHTMAGSAGAAEVTALKRTFQTLHTCLRRWFQTS